IGYLPQEEVVTGEGSILENALAGIPDLLNLEKKIHSLHTALNTTDKNHDALLKKLGPMEQRYRDLGGYIVESKAKKILSGLGFTPSMFEDRHTELSGGWYMRIHLARLLLLEPDLLLLDEPTNHLDIPSMEWLEQYLLQFKGSIVIVSHDRYFIDRLSHEIYELDRGELNRYKGNYHVFEKQKEEKNRLIHKRHEEQRMERVRIQRFIDRYRSDKRRASQVQSRLRMLEKMETIELPPLPRRLNFNLDVETISYKDVLSMEGVSFRYDKDWVLDGLDLHLSRGEKIAMVGVNGAGKTTLTRLIVKKLSPQKGSVQLGNRVIFGHYAQHQINALNLDSTVFDEVASTAATGLIQRLREVLGIFQFGEEDIKKRIGVLSGGEKARVSLAKILLSPVNFLIMDEPTTHLDITSREALEEALQKYNGTLMLISHDRYFLDKLVSRTIELKESRLFEYHGNYSYYLWKREQKQEMETPRDLSPVLESESTGKKPKEQKRLEAEARQSISKERKTLQMRVKSIEEEVGNLEARKQEIEALLADPGTYQEGEEVGRLNKEYAEVKERIISLYSDWDIEQGRLEVLVKNVKGQN
ncbi:ABC-F family ATP-binding cassette domain-containing protein, partial [Acidobacteriota bacterium]